jgi:hypothetical protein
MTQRRHSTATSFLTSRNLIWLHFIVTLWEFLSGFDWLIIYGFTSRSRIFHICRRHRATKFRPMLGAQGLWAGRDLYRATPAVTRGLGFSGLIRRNAPFSRLLRHPRGCGGSILTRILTGHWLIDCLRIFHLYGDVTIAGKRATKLKPMLGVQGLWAGRDLYRATPTATWGLGCRSLVVVLSLSKR